MYKAGKHILICGEYSDPKLHSHNATHIMISLGEKIDIITENGKERCKGILIPAGMLHTAYTNKNKVLVFLFDSTTNVANQIKTLNKLADEAVDEIVKAYYFFENSNKSGMDYKKFIDCVYKGIGINSEKNAELDKRIVHALAYIDKNLHEPITCREVAKKIFLSEGRFSHVFKEEMGVTFSKYLVHKRIMETYTKIINGKSITMASL